MPTGNTPRTLILVGGLPGDRNVGEILLRDMLELVDQQHYVVASLLGPRERAARHLSETTLMHGSTKVHVFPRPVEHSGATSNSKLQQAQTAIHRSISYRPAVRQLSAAIHKLAQAERIERIWAILNITSVIDVAHALSSIFPCEMLTHVWDDVEHLSHERLLDALSRRRLISRFSSLLARSSRTAVICEAMADHYRHVHKARCQIIRHGVSDTVTPRLEQTSSTEFRIAFSGGLYALTAWNTLQEALALMNWQVAGKRIKLVVLSNNVTLTARAGTNIEFLGWRSPEEVLEILPTCDVLYLPQPFEASQRPLAQLSFPTKLSAYVGVGRPVLIHSPDYGSLTEFFKYYPVGSLCQTLNPQDVVHSIAALASDPARYRDAARTAALVATEVLSQSSFKSQVRSFLEEPHAPNISQGAQCIKSKVVLQGGK